MFILVLKLTWDTRCAKIYLILKIIIPKTRITTSNKSIVIKKSEMFIRNPAIKLRIFRKKTNLTNSLSSIRMLVCLFVPKDLSNNMALIQCEAFARSWIVFIYLF